MQKAHNELVNLQQSSAPAAETREEEAHREDDLLLPQNAIQTQPVRPIEFPRGFQTTLASFPAHITRATMVLTGRLATGEPAAFVGALRLKGCPTISRQRVGSDFRLLFRLLPDRVQVIDLINRKDLERKIKTLA